MIPNLVTKKENQILTALPSLEEVKTAIFGINRMLLVVFSIKKYCHNIGRDVYEAVIQFFTKSWIHTCKNSNILNLIPKVNNVSIISDFWPIALANVRYKIISKILADRLSSVATRIGSKNQNGFFKGRDIKNCIIVASEAVNLLNKKAFGSYVVLKVDTKRVFGTLNWGYLLSVLNDSEFNDRFCYWVKTILDSASLYMNKRELCWFL